MQDKTQTALLQRIFGRNKSVKQNAPVLPKQDDYKIEAERIFYEIEHLIDKNPDNAVKVSASMALAGGMNIGVSLNLMLLILEKQMAMGAMNV